MTAQPQKTFDAGLIDRLPAVRGRLTENAAIGHMTWFGVGGPAEVLFKPEDKDDLAQFIAACPADIPVTVLGVASNLIVRDGGIPGVVIRMGREFAQIAAEDTVVTAGAAALDINVALTAAKHHIAGLEFLSGIPGTIGGALRMNAGAYGGETKDVLRHADVLLRDGSIKTMTGAEMGLTYRHNDLPDDVIFLSATFDGQKGVQADIESRMDDIKTKRGETQPIKTKTGGSTFANPEGHKAWQLVDSAGCRGLQIGGAQVSELHCNFLLNTGGATAADIERLGEEVRKRVAENSGVMLRWEIKRIGVPLPEDKDILSFMKG
ncbi:MAG: UDP-N-acetylmuramate dehydrogenase [Bdellovibrionales bacterium]|jgi:UDP-N-acetylmuramate dehydrogenase|nr:UDP-N-acetylmuramate dehydrogenase [Bdellovibrionales bacterium]